LSHPTFSANDHVSFYRIRTTEEEFVLEKMGLCRLSVATIPQRLRRVYGPVEPPAQWPLLDELVATILSQNTSDANSGAAFDVAEAAVRAAGREIPIDDVTISIRGKVLPD
jgi:hypothetical protein